MNLIRLDRSHMRNTIPAYRRRRSLGQRWCTTTTPMAIMHPSPRSSVERRLLIGLPIAVPNNSFPRRPSGYG